MSICLICLFVQKSPTRFVPVPRTTPPPLKKVTIVFRHRASPTSSSASSLH